MADKNSGGGATYSSRRFLRKGSFVAEIKADGNMYRFVIRDENRTKPSIHGSKKSMQESESEVKTVLEQLCLMDRAA
jgi:hypothetical protein